MIKSKIEQRNRRRKRIRAKVFGTKEMPRLSVFKSNKYVYAQLINDDDCKTVAASSSAAIKGKGKTEQAKQVGIDLAKKAEGLKIKKVVFDRGGFIYTGRVKALAEGAREGGLKF